MLLSRSINPSAPTLSPCAIAYNPTTMPTILNTIDTTPKKLEWKLTPKPRFGMQAQG